MLPQRRQLIAPRPRLLCLSDLILGLSDLILELRDPLLERRDLLLELRDPLPEPLLARLCCPSVLLLELRHLIDLLLLERFRLARLGLIVVLLFHLATDGQYVRGLSLIVEMALTQPRLH